LITKKEIKIALTSKQSEPLIRSGSN